MIDHCNRWLLGFAAAYLALLPTNAATIVHSVAFGGAVVLALVVLGLARRYDPAAVPSPGWPVLAALGAWCLWSLLSLAWSIDPAYSQTQLEREIGDSLSVMLVFYIAARDARSFRTLAAAALASFAVLAALAIGIDFFAGPWDAGRYHHGVGPWSTLSVLIAPLLFALVAPPPIGFANGARSIAAGLALVAMLVVTDRMTDNRIVWIALAAVFGVASLPRRCAGRARSCARRCAGSAPCSRCWSCSASRSPTPCASAPSAPARPRPAWRRRSSATRGSCCGTGSA